MINYHIEGIEKYPHLRKRLDYEIRRLGNNCADCEKRKVIDKYRDIVRKEIARSEAISQNKTQKKSR